VELLVTLAEQTVGTIRTLPDGRNEFAFAGEYLRAGRRPVLGQWFEDHLDEVHHSRTRLPPFFSNLLPEGGLRELVARRAGVHPDREAELISVLGEDLPGAVVVRRQSPPDAEPVDASLNDEGPAADAPLRFSLAGAQLKFSVLYRAGGRGPTIPIDGRGGNWIAKLPSETYPAVPEHEHAIIRWARRSGIQVPEVKLVRAGEVEGLPVALPADRLVFLSRRYDRADGGERIHQEDFAQVANVRHGERYGSLSYTSIARIVRAVAGEEDFDEVVRRLAFNILIGNGDAHLKNWALVYPDGIAARLSPAYDLVATVTFIPADRLALKLGRENRFEAIGLGHFERLAEKVDAEPVRVTRTVRELIQAAMAGWPPSGELEPENERLLRQHTSGLALVREAG